MKGKGWLKRGSWVSCDRAIEANAMRDGRGVPGIRSDRNIS
ncbi:hypothetical protein [Phormidium sp. CCY1219]|nr:hypothetical protein [Phormidium sp. CCY1219]